MAVYVGDDKNIYASPRICYIAADTQRELLRSLTGLNPLKENKRFEYSTLEHYIINEIKKAKAIKNGAITLTPEEFIAYLLDREAGDYLFVSTKGKLPLRRV